MMRLPSAAWVLTLLLVSACGGGKNSPPPPAATPNMAQSLQTLQALAENAKQVCCQQAAPYMVAYGTMIYSPTPQAINTLPSPQMNACTTAVQNFELQFRTIDNGAYANRTQPQQWRQEQGKAIINCVGASMQTAGLPVGPMNYAAYMPAAMQIGNQISSSVPSVGGFQGYIPAMPGGSTSLSVNLPQGTASLTNNYAANGLPSAYPFNSGVQVMPYLPMIPAGY